MFVPIERNPDLVISKRVALRTGCVAKFDGARDNVAWVALAARDSHVDECSPGALESFEVLRLGDCPLSHDE